MFLLILMVAVDNENPGRVGAGGPCRSSEKDKEGQKEQAVPEE
jgi:hypothetical protein